MLAALGQLVDEEVAGQLHRQPLLIDGNLAHLVGVRARARVRVSDLYHSPKVASVAVHKEQPVLAVGSRRQLLKLYHLGTKKRITIKAHSDFWGSRLGPISALCFHPTQQLLATGAANDHLSVFSYEASSWTTVM